MVDATLVDAQIDDGEDIIRQLDSDRFGVDSALWFFDTDKEKWMFLIATQLVNTIGPKEAYARIKESLDNLDKPLSSPTLDITLIKPDVDLLQILKSAVKVGPGISRMRFTGNVINGKLIEDALIYRLSDRR